MLYLTGTDIVTRREMVEQSLLCSTRQGLTLQVQDQGLRGGFTHQSHLGHLDNGNSGI